MPMIRPISDLRNHFSRISEIVHKDDEPVFLTRNGIGDMVVMSIEHYEKQFIKTSLYGELEKAENEITMGAKGKNAMEFLKSLKN